VDFNGCILLYDVQSTFSLDLKYLVHIFWFAPDEVSHCEQSILIGSRITGLIFSLWIPKSAEPGACLFFTIFFFLVQIVCCSLFSPRTCTAQSCFLDQGIRSVFQSWPGARAGNPLPPPFSLIVCHSRIHFCRPEPRSPSAPIRAQVLRFTLVPGASARSSPGRVFSQRCQALAYFNFASALRFLALSLSPHCRFHLYRYGVSTVLILRCWCWFCDYDWSYLFWCGLL
jgi:hypothetical protein